MKAPSGGRREEEPISHLPFLLFVFFAVIIICFVVWRLLVALVISKFPVASKALVIASDTGIILDVRGEIEAICGWKPGDLIGENISVMIPRAMREDHRTGMEIYRRTGKGPVVGNTLKIQAVGPDDILHPIWLTVFGYEKYSDMVHGLIESRIS